jgi:hypothetical protein
MVEKGVITQQQQPAHAHSHAARLNGKGVGNTTAATTTTATTAATIRTVRSRQQVQSGPGAGDVGSVLTRNQ